MTASLEQTVRDVVQRARAGDQIAMGLLAVTRDSAKNGNPAAKQSARLIKRFIRQNPPHATMGAEPIAGNGVKSNPKAVQAIWECPVNNFPAILVQACPFVTLWEAVACCVHKSLIRPDSTLAKAAPVKDSKLGAVVRRAIGIQCLRNQDFPISRYCPVSGWELGE